MLPVYAAVLFAGLALGDCNADNCLRALRATQTPGRLASAQSFCATFTAASSSATAIPTYAVDACKANQVGSQNFRISSACKCIAAPTSSVTASATATGGACATVSSLWSASKAAAPSGEWEFDSSDSVSYLPSQSNPNSSSLNRICVS